MSATHDIPFDDRLDRSPTEIERRLLDAFDDALEIDEPLPPHLVNAAQDYYTWRTVDAELLELLVDSAETELALVRSDDSLQRFIAFGDDDHGVNFECRLERDGFALAGSVAPPGSYEIHLDHGSADLEVTSDDLGGFEIRCVAPGSVRLTIRDVAASERLMVTPWFLLRS